MAAVREAAMTHFLRSLCRVLTFTLLWAGIDQLAPALPWWAHGGLYLGAAAALQFGWLGAGGWETANDPRHSPRE